MTEFVDLFVDGRFYTRMSREAYEEAEESAAVMRPHIQRMLEQGQAAFADLLSRPADPVGEDPECE